MTERNDPAGSRSGDAGAVTKLLLGTTREWFASALEAVLHSAGFSVVRGGSADEMVDLTDTEAPDLVIVDESLPDNDVPALCRRLVEGPLGPSVPLVVYTESYSGEGIHAEALEAGAWEIVSEPIRARVLVAALNRLLDLGRRMAASAAETPLWDEETGLFTSVGLERVLPSLQALAERKGVRMSCVVLGPTQLGRGEVLRRQRVATADLCSVNVRASDVCGWLGTGELAIIAFDTPADGATSLAERLNEVASGRAEVKADSRTLSAGIVEMNGSVEGAGRGHESERGEAAPAAVPLGGLRAARDALLRAREHGGGIRVADVA